MTNPPRHANAARPVDFPPPVVKSSPLGGPAFARPSDRRDDQGEPRPAHGALPIVEGPRLDLRAVRIAAMAEGHLFRGQR